MRFQRFAMQLLVLSALLGCFITVQAEVLMWEEDVEIPTYTIGPPEEAPIFYAGRVYQGAQGRVYPYPLIAEIHHDKAPRPHRMVYLENEYVKVALMPGAGGGGRIFSALDKTTGYDFFYRQNVIKPGLISALGAWISGGIEWNVPHHHRTSTFLPTDYKLRENPDGSKTVWMGEVELRHRMKWMVGVTLHPGSSQVQVEGRLYNRTPMVNSFLFFANVAVHADSSYETIFPTNQQWGVGHGKHAFTTWPLSTGDDVMGSTGYKPGTELGWWKVHPSPISIFAHNATGDFLAGYNHGKDAGVVHVADHHLVPGKKLWQWGPGDAGRMWDNVLTDEDGPYIELMVGAYSDNQPDYSWIQPYETKQFTMTWWPLAKIGGVKQATLEAAVNLEPAGKGKARVAFNSSRRYEAAHVLVRAGEKVLLEETAAVAPDAPFSREIKLPAGVTVKDIDAALFDAAGKMLVAYKEVEEPKLPEPEHVVPPEAPEKIASLEQLYLAGQRLEQFHNAAIAPEPYYLEALRRDSLDYRNNTAMGIWCIRHGMFERARTYLETAVRRVTAQHTRSRDGEAQYYLGMALRALGEMDKAVDQLYDASWSAAFYAPAFYELARIATLRGEYAAALEYVDRSLTANLLNNRALCLKAAILRRSGRAGQAAEVARMMLVEDPLEHWAASELALALSDMGQAAMASAVRDTLGRVMRDSYQNYLELAADYGGCGLWDEAAGVLKQTIDMDNAYAGYNSLGVSEAPSLTDGSRALAWYYLGYCRKMQGDTAAAAECYATGSQQPSNLVFPFRLESILILRDVMAARPDDPMPRYYLGNLLFDSQPEAALALWEAARDRGGDFTTLHRNLGLAYDRVKHDSKLAIASMEKAHELDPHEAEVTTELDQLYETSNVEPAKRLAVLEQHAAVALANDGLLARMVTLLTRLGNYDRAIELLQSHVFAVWEGSGNIHDVWMDALLGRGIQRLAAGQYDGALADFRLAMTWPANLAVGRPRDGGREPEFSYYIGKTLEKMGQAAKAKAEYKLAVSDSRPADSELAFHQALAWKALGDNARADKIFGELAAAGNRILDGSRESGYFAKFGVKRTESQVTAEAHYLVGLGALGKGDKEQAKKEFSLAIENDVNHFGASRRLAGM